MSQGSNCRGDRSSAGARAAGESSKPTSKYWRCAFCALLRSTAMRRSSSTPLATCLFAALLPAAAHGDPTLASLWNHNGSVMALYVAGDEHEMRYQEPRIGMRQEGVMPGTVRFKGTLSGNTYA